VEETLTAPPPLKATLTTEADSEDDDEVDFDDYYGFYSDDDSGLDSDDDSEFDNDDFYEVHISGYDAEVEPDYHAERLSRWTPLHIAAGRGDSDLLRLLLDHGADPNCGGRGVCDCRDRARRTYCTSSNVENLVTRWSPLHVAVSKGKLDCAEELLGRFGLPHDPEPAEAVLGQARHIARREPWLSTMSLGETNSMTPEFDLPPLLHVAAAKYASVEALDRLCNMLDRAGCLGGPSPSPSSGLNLRDGFGDTPFAVCAFRGHIDVLGSYLRDRGANINASITDDKRRPRSVLNALCKCFSL
jgi:ankyrin repeat protein